MKTKRKKLSAFLLSVVMVTAMLPMAVFAAEDTTDIWDGTADTSWYDPNDVKFSYEITTAEQLAGLANLVNDDNDFDGITFTLKKDIDLSGHEWIPIGTGNNASGYFGGVFDGEYHSVLNMKTGKTHHGLFGIVNGGTVKNLGVENADITFAKDDGSLRAGILADWVHNATIANCFTTGNMFTNTKGDKFVGGIAGQGMYGATIIGCYSSAVIESRAVDSAEGIGGIVGSWETKGSQPMIADCYFDGEILFRGGPLDNQDPYLDCGMANNVGGILGMCFDNEPDLIIKNCMVATETVEAPSDYNMEYGNGGMWIAWYEMTGMPENCYWPIDDREWPASIAFETYSNSYGNDGLYFEECGTPTADFKDPSVLQGLQTNAQPGVTWVMGMEHPTFHWDERNIAANYDLVDEAIEKANALDADLYTNYTDVVATIEAVDRNKSKAEQAEVDGYAAAIETAIAALEYKEADYSKVDEAIEKAEALDKNQYKDFSKVEAVLAAVVRGKNITEQAVVDGYAAAIENAIATLEYKAADYTKVDEAIEKAEALNKDDYKDFSKLEASLAAVVRGKNITEQAEVDAMAKAIEDALSGLEKKAPSGSGEEGTDSPQTGDNSNIFLIVVLLLISGAGLTGTVVYSRRRKHGK